jgi:hypothetical protein
VETKCRSVGRNNGVVHEVGKKETGQEKMDKKLFAFNLPRYFVAPSSYLSRARGVSGNGFYKGLPLVTALVSLLMPLEG